MMMEVKGGGALKSKSCWSLSLTVEKDQVATKIEELMNRSAFKKLKANTVNVKVGNNKRKQLKHILKQLKQFYCSDVGNAFLSEIARNPEDMASSVFTQELLRIGRNILRGVGAKEALIFGLPMIGIPAVSIPAVVSGVVAAAAVSWLAANICDMDLDDFTDAVWEKYRGQMPDNRFDPSQKTANPVDVEQVDFGSLENLLTKPDTTEPGTTKLAYEGLDHGTIKYKVVADNPEDIQELHDALNEARSKSKSESKSDD